MRTQSQHQTSLCTGTQQPPMQQSMPSVSMQRTVPHWGRSCPVLAHMGACWALPCRRDSRVFETPDRMSRTAHRHVNIMAIRLSKHTTKRSDLYVDASMAIHLYIDHRVREIYAHIVPMSCCCPDKNNFTFVKIKMHTSAI